MKRFVPAIATTCGVLAIVLFNVSIWVSSWPHGRGDTWSSVIQFDAFVLVLVAFVLVMWPVES